MVAAVLEQDKSGRERTMDDKYNMDGHKLLWHLDRVNSWQNGERIVPLHIDMGITTGCNMACTYCYGVIQGRSGYGTSSGDIRHMPGDAILRLFADARQTGVRSVALIGEGENTLNPDLPRALEFAHSIGLDLGLATNGVRLDIKMADLFLSTLTWLRINISAASADAFRNIHRTDQFERVLDNIRNLVETKAKYGYPCTLGMQMVVTRDNFDQIVPLARLGRELGVDYLVIKPCSDTPEGNLRAPHDEYAEQANIYDEAASHATDGYAVIPKISKLMSGGKRDYPVCMGTPFIIAISGDGSVFPCGHWFSIRRDEFLMGNVINDSFSDIVAGERYWEVQERIRGLDVERDCETNCRQHYINSFLWKLSNPPDHLNFI